MDGNLPMLPLQRKALAAVKCCRRVVQAGFSGRRRLKVCSEQNFGLHKYAATVHLPMNVLTSQELSPICADG